MREGQEIIFIYNGSLLKGVLWEKGLLDYLVKSPQIAGLTYIRHEQVVSNGVTREAIEFLNKSY